MRSLLGILALDRPKALNECLLHLLDMDDRKDVDIFLVDNGSNEATQEVIDHWRKDVDCVIHNPWNYGYCFGVNSWMATRQPGQHCIQIDQDLIMHSLDWWLIMKPFLDDPDVGMLAARRPSAWIDRADKREGYKNLRFEERHGHWVEIPSNNCLIAPILVYKGSLLDQIGFENEASGYGDLESYIRVALTGLKSMYIPDIFLYQLPNDWEGAQHPQRGAHNDLLRKNALVHQKMVRDYVSGGRLYCGTRFKEGSITDPWYQKMSDENFEFHKNWRML